MKCLKAKPSTHCFIPNLSYNDWTIRRRDDRPSNPATQRIILKIDGFLVLSTKSQVSESQKLLQSLWSNRSKIDFYYKNKCAKVLIMTSLCCGRTESIPFKFLSKCFFRRETFSGIIKSFQCLPFVGLLSQELQMHSLFDRESRIAIHYIVLCRMWQVWWIWWVRWMWPFSKV